MKHMYGGHCVLWGVVLPCIYFPCRQDHYPERLGLAFFVNTPWLLHSFFTAASTFLDPVA